MEPKLLEVSPGVHWEDFSKALQVGRAEGAVFLATRP